MSKRPQSPLQKPPQSGRPFSPTTPSSSAISYHQAEEQQWLSTGDQPRDTRVFGLKPRSRSSSPSPSPILRYQRPNEQLWSSPTQEQKRDDRMFGSKPSSSSQSPVSENQKMNEQQWSSNLGEPQRDTRVFGSSPRPASTSPTQVNAETGQKTQTVNQSNESANQRAFDSQFESNQMPRDNRVFAPNKPGLQKSAGFGIQRPKGTRELQTGRVIRDRRWFGNQNKPPLQAMGGSLDDWKAPLPHMKSAPQTDQLLPSQTKQQQTYINQLPPSERVVRPSLTGNVRRRIRPVWPPPDHNDKFIPKAGFNPSGRGIYYLFDLILKIKIYFKINYCFDSIRIPASRLAATTITIN